VEQMAKTASTVKELIRNKPLIGTIESTDTKQKK
jgi:hypothetical protein